MTLFLENFREIKKNSCYNYKKFFDYTKIVKNYMKLAERIWKKFEIVSEIFKNFEKHLKNKHSRNFCNKITQK